MSDRWHDGLVPVSLFVDRVLCDVGAVHVASYTAGVGDFGSRHSRVQFKHRSVNAQV